MPVVPLPAGMRAKAARSPAWSAFVDRLPRLVGELLAEWTLVVDGVPTHGFASLVVPVRRDQEPAVLKVTFPDEQTEHEALGLQRWGGAGAARLLSADPHRGALLVERLHARDLGHLPDVAACEVVAGLYARLHVPAPPQLRPVTAYVARQADDLAALPRDAPLPLRLREQALALARDLVADPTSTGRMVHGDLHSHNVLAADREPWLVIDPQPMSGEVHYELAPMLWSCWERLVESGDVRTGVRRRFHTLVDAAGLDEDRARDWVVVRMVLDASRDLVDHPGPPDQEWITRCISIAKAVQD